MNDGVLNGESVLWEDRACSEETALRWLNLIKGYNREYKLLLKRHFNSAIPRVDSADIIVCSDNQEMPSFTQLVAEANSFAEKYAGSGQPYCHQVGYDSDSHIYDEYDVFGTC